MEETRDNIVMINIEKGNKNNWKSKSKEYLLELEKFLDKIEQVENQDIRKDILMQMLRCDNELTLLSERLFEEFYNQGFQEGKNSKGIS